MVQEFKGTTYLILTILNLYTNYKFKINLSITFLSQHSFKLLNSKVNCTLVSIIRMLIEILIGFFTNVYIKLYNNNFTFTNTVLENKTFKFTLNSDTFLELILN